MIPNKKKPKRLVVGEDEQKTMTDIVTGKSQYRTGGTKRYRSARI
jgi:hypothetical protein